MAKYELIEIVDLGVKIHRIHEDVYTEDLDIYGKAIFYSQIVQIWKKLGISRESGNESIYAKALETHYLSEAPTFAEHLLDCYNRESLEFEPQFIVRAPTRNRDLQQAVFNKFSEEFSLEDNDLSGFFDKDEQDSIILTEDISKTLNDKKNILIIDDTYATGKTVKVLIRKIGLEKSYAVVCPLLVKQ